MNYVNITKWLSIVIGHGQVDVFYFLSNFSVFVNSPHLAELTYIIIISLFFYSDFFLFSRKTCNHERRTLSLIFRAKGQRKFDDSQFQLLISYKNFIFPKNSFTRWANEDMQFNKHEARKYWNENSKVHQQLAGLEIEGKQTVVPFWGVLCVFFILFFFFVHNLNVFTRKWRITIMLSPAKSKLTVFLLFIYWSRFVFPFSFSWFNEITLRKFLWNGNIYICSVGWFIFEYKLFRCN